MLVIQLQTTGGARGGHRPSQASVDQARQVHQPQAHQVRPAAAVVTALVAVGDLSRKVWTKPGRPYGPVPVAAPCPEAPPPPAQAAPYSSRRHREDVGVGGSLLLGRAAASLVIHAP